MVWNKPYIRASLSLKYVVTEPPKVVLEFGSLEEGGGCNEVLYVAIIAVFTRTADVYLFYTNTDIQC